ncbi:MAG: MlaD family protein [Candidatus Adiutrix sp.]|jgi:phospholipid/cholesterol/gamma-HCH transport system substrate-binding protein|nr:MlaD family protein [Candidatus Adiutrix sp.]
MHAPYTRREKLAGLFLLAGLAVGFAITVVVGGGQDWFRQYNQYYAIFNNGYGLEPGVKVKFLRTDIGLVTRLELTDNNKVKVHLAIREDFADRLKTDSVANINSPTFIGSEFIDILPGSPKTALIPDGGQIPAVERKSLSEYVEDLHLDIMLARVEDTMTNVASLTSQLQEPAGPFLGTMSDVRNITSTVAGGQGNLGRLIHDEEAYDKVNQSLGDVNAITGNLAGLSGHLNRDIPPIVAQVEQGARNLPEIGRGVHEGIRSATQILESVKRNFLIRGNLPREPAVETPTVPARQGF